MDVFTGLSLWPWFLAAGHSFAATVFFAPRLLRGTAGTGLHLLFYAWSLGGAAAIAALVGGIEKANAGEFAGHTTANIVGTIAVLALFGALVAVVPTIAAVKLPRKQRKRNDAA
jgi:hypothetical protein